MKIREYIDSNFGRIIEDIREIIKVRTVKDVATSDAPFGQNLKYGLEKTLKIAEKLGFKVKNLNNYIGYAEIGESKEYIAILGHIDVVPEGDVTKWSVNPYTGVIRDNLLIGRGALDNKAPIISSLYSIKAILEENPNFNKRVRVIFGTNEPSIISKCIQSAPAVSTALISFSKLAKSALNIDAETIILYPP